MRLSDFILKNMESILAEWEIFARSVEAGTKMDRLALRDHAEDILRATVRDMTTAQSDNEQFDKSIGQGADGTGSKHLDEASEVHGVGRVGSGFDLGELVSEYRALRASVIKLWRDTNPNPHATDIDDLTRFHESIDQSLRKAVVGYTGYVDRSRQMFLAILAHDLRNPLNSILLSAEVVSLTATGDPDTIDAAHRITSSVKSIAQMVTDLLDFAGTGVGSAMPLSPAPMDLAKLCRELHGEFQAAHPTCTLSLKTTQSLNGIWDASRIRQVLSNLLGNAFQHGGETCNAKLTVTADGPDVVLAVHNCGTPIPPELLPTIFQPLVQGERRKGKPQRRAGSIGLGLYIAREVVLAHGGTITVQSTKESGTTFTVRLPRKHSAPGG
ncbi:sensor histidine kinase [Humisphaera borealis]|uniref:histidine kinase n=1 Tax=Humisphaera borealis TaxID=2807512 RepID=A0A7M2WWQ2_9BACT|nr:sensor histidine kinase [Humisphaera borealis]QOV89925.1 sensor histidine kinase [Humisphaera borealis]